MRICITGSEGFLGSYIAKELSDHEIIPFDITLGQDCTKFEDCLKAFEGVDIVIHVAAIASPSYGSPTEVFNTNVISTHNVHEAAVQCGVKKVIFTSSEAVYGFFFNPEVQPEYRPINEKHPLRPTDPYGLSKKIGEAISEAYAHGLITCCVRPTAIMKPGIPNHAKYKTMLERGEFPTDRDSYGYIDVEDLAKVYRTLVEKDVYGPYNANTVSMGKDLKPWISNDKLRLLQS